MLFCSKNVFDYEYLSVQTFALIIIHVKNRNINAVSQFMFKLAFKVIISYLKLNAMVLIISLTRAWFEPRYRHRTLIILFLLIIWDLIHFCFHMTTEGQTVPGWLALCSNDQRMQVGTVGQHVSRFDCPGRDVSSGLYSRRFV